MLKYKQILKSARCVAVLLAGLGCALSATASTFLRAEEAYRTEAAGDAAAIQVTFRIQDGYYLYRNRLAFSSETEALLLADAELPKGLPHSDEYFGEQEIYRGVFTVRLPYKRSSDVRSVVVKVRLQGCADAGLCYPPQTRLLTVTLPASAAVATASSTGGLLGRLGVAAGRAPDLLPADDAFRPSAEIAGQNLVVHVAIAEGYYLYRDRFRLSSDPATTLGQPVWPRGETHHDEYFGDQTVFRGDLRFVVPYTGVRPQQLRLTYQGCADAGLCYTPQTRVVPLAPVDAATPSAIDGANSAPSAGAEQDKLARLVRSGHWWVVLGAFWFFGLLLAFTPCVLPMVPILAGIIAGDGAKTTPARSFALAAAYVGGMAVTYTSVGVAFAAAGAQAQAVFQQPWILVLFAGLFVALAFSMFGFYELALPASLQTRFAEVSGRFKGGRMASSAVMGALSSLIVTACVAPPLVATFVVIGQAGAIGRGALALGSLSLGMGTPLLLVGASAGRLLPKTGPWMETVKALFGVVFLGVAVWMLDRLVPPRWTMLGWTLVAASTVWVLARTGNPAARAGWLRRIALALATLYAAVLLGSFVLGGTDPLHPTQGTRFGPATTHPLAFQRIKTAAELDRVLATARAEQRPVMLDFSADWCVSCKEMDAHTFNVAAVQAALGRYVVLRADVTANDIDDQALLQRFGIFGPPTTAFFKPDGQERREFRLVGYVDADDFMHHLTRFEAAQ